MAEMNAHEICVMFKEARNKRYQINILADLTASDVETITEVLRDAGLYVRTAQCKRCGVWFEQYTTPYCRECETETGYWKRMPKTAILDD